MSAKKNFTEQQGQSSAQENAKLKPIVSRKKRSKKPNGYWLVKENLLREAKKYKTKSEMKAKSNVAYISMYKLGLSDILFPTGKKSNGYWTIARCFDAAKLYMDISDFSTGDHKTAYTKLCRENLIMQATSHMKRVKVSNNHWTKENCLIEAGKYKTRNEFRIFSNGAYDKALKNGWINEITSHMKSGYQSSDCVYVWKVKGFNETYKIGLTKETIVHNRMEFVAKSNSIEIESYAYFNIASNAYHSEQVALSLGVRSNEFSGDGYTEFRVLSELEYKNLIDFLSGESNGK